PRTPPSSVVNRTGQGLTRSNSWKRTPARNASHSRFVNVRTGPSGFFESRTWTSFSIKRTSTQLLGSLALLLNHRGDMLSEPCISHTLHLYDQPPDARSGG